MTKVKTPGQYESEAIAASVRMRYAVFYATKVNRLGRMFLIYRRIPGGKVSLIKRTYSETELAATMRRAEKAMKPVAAKPRKNPSSRNSTEAAKALATRFHGREPAASEYRKVAVPQAPKSMACIGDIFAIEYLAERDGKEYRFRHVFKAKSRPQLAVSPDGTVASMIGGSWFFGDDGFEDC